MFLLLSTGSSAAAREGKRDKTIQVIKLLHSTGANTHNLINRLSISMHFFFFFFFFRFRFVSLGKCRLSHCCFQRLRVRRNRPDGLQVEKKKRKRFGARARQVTSLWCAHTKSPPFYKNVFFSSSAAKIDKEKKNDSPRKKKKSLLFLL